MRSQYLCLATLTMDELHGTLTSYEMRQSNKIMLPRNKHSNHLIIQSKRQSQISVAVISHKTMKK
jgi:hypothetical protein